MHATVIAAAAASLLATALTAAPAQADHSWGGYHWARSSNPFTLALGDNVDSRWDSHLAVAANDWTASTVLDTVIVRGSTKPRSCRGTTGRVEVCNASYGNNGWLGLASISISGGTHITAGTVKVNDYYFDMPQYDTPAWRAFVMCQEVGHTFGLDHQDEDFTNPNLGSCMDYTNSPGTNQHPNQHDYDQLVTIYGHQDATTTVGAATTAGAAPAGAGNTPAGWGRQVEGSRAAGHSTFVRNDGHGRLLVTFVTWA